MSTPTAPRLVVVGDVMLDHVLEFDEEQAPDEKVVPTWSDTHIGGTALNAAVVAHRLGAPVDLVSRVGDDPIGPWLLDQVRSLGLPTTHIQTARGPSPRATILLRPTRRTVVVEAGVASGLRMPSDSRLRESDLVYVSYSPQAAADLVDQGHGDQVILGLEAWMLHEPRLLSSLRRVRLVITNWAGWLAIAALRRHQRPERLIVTKGAEGAEIRTADGHIQSVPPHAVVAQDATGAGDAFAGTLCRYLLDGFDLLDSAKRAAIAGALVATARGARGYVPDEAAIQACLR